MRWYKIKHRLAHLFHTNAVEPVSFLVKHLADDYILTASKCLQCHELNDVTWRLTPECFERKLKHYINMKGLAAAVPLLYNHIGAGVELPEKKNGTVTFCRYEHIPSEDQ